MINADRNALGVICHGQGRRANFQWAWPSAASRHARAARPTGTAVTIGSRTNPVDLDLQTFSQSAFSLSVNTNSDGMLNITGGTFPDSLRRARKVGGQPAPHGPFYMLIPAGEALAGTNDANAAREFLRKKGQITGAEGFNGLALGVAPVTGSGSLTVESWEVIRQ